MISIMLKKVEDQEDVTAIENGVLAVGLRSQSLHVLHERERD
jgi:hypothetical protein